MAKKKKSLKKANKPVSRPPAKVESFTPGPTQNSRSEVPPDVQPPVQPEAQPVAPSVTPPVAKQSYHKLTSGEIEPGVFVTRYARDLGSAGVVVTAIFHNANGDPIGACEYFVPGVSPLGNGELGRRFRR